MESLWKGNLHKNKNYVNNPQTVFQKYLVCIEHFNLTRGRRGRDRMVVGFITTYAISAYHH